jgi:NADH-quinone oxidoreductase subunit J
MTALFYTSAAIAVISALLVVTGTNVMRAVLSLLVFLLASASVFYTLGGPFIAVLQIVVYAGAIMVLFVFVVMMLNQGKEAQVREQGRIGKTMWYLPVLLAGVLLVEFAVTVGGPVPGIGKMVPPKAVGVSLFKDYIVGVELASVLLLAALAAAYHFARSARASEEDDE